MKVYLASPLGFSELGKTGLKRVKAKLEQLGHTVFDPWDKDFKKLVEAVGSSPIHATNAAQIIGGTNRIDIDDADCVFAVLDGQELDSGTVAEMAYAVGTGKTVHAYRGDFRDLGELPYIPFNLQVWYFLQLRGGKLFRSVHAIDF